MNLSGAILILILFAAAQPAAAARGDVVSSKLRERLPAQEAATIAAPFGEVRHPFAVEVYELHYRTLDGKGHEVTASGAVALPVGAPPAPLVSIQHGTVFGRNDVPSRLPPRWLGEGLSFASSGYVAVMPDYVGYGASAATPHPYLHGRSLGISVVDMLRGTRTFLTKKGFSLDGRLFLTGYSEGGYATLAAHRELEEHHANEFSVTASAPMAGPYDLMLTMEVLMRRGSAGSVPYLAYAFWAYDRIYDLHSLRGIVREPYRSRILRMFGGSATSAEVDGSLPSRARDLFEPAFLKAWRGKGAKRVKQLAHDNALTYWKPKAPVVLYHCTGDTVVPVENATAARDAFAAQGADVQAVLREGGEHGMCFQPLVREGLRYFDTLRGGP